MDAPPRDDLDALTKAAADRLQAPMAFVSLLDDRRVFFASAVGITGEMATTRENQVEASYCQHVVAFDDVLVVSDSSTDPLVADNVATTAGGTRAYLGVPIRRRGHCLGSFCVVDTQARAWSEDDLAMLQELADTAMANIA